SGIARVLPSDSLDRILSAVGRPAGPLYVPLDVTTREESRLKEFVFGGRDVRNLRPLVDSMRLVKDADEIARMRKAVDISAAGHVAAMQAARPGMWEYEIEAVVEAAFRRHGADRLGYPSIVGSGQPCDAYFIHRLGHWLGMDVHDVGDYGTPLKPGMVLTLEPGIYLAAEGLGVRIEDDVLVTPAGAEWLSAKAPKTTAEIER